MSGAGFTMSDSWRGVPSSVAVVFLFDLSPAAGDGLVCLVCLGAFLCDCNAVSVVALEAYIFTSSNSSFFRALKSVGVSSVV